MDKNAARLNDYDNKKGTFMYFISHFLKYSGHILLFSVLKPIMQMMNGLIVVQGNTISGSDD